MIVSELHLPQVGRALSKVNFLGEIAEFGVGKSNQLEAIARAGFELSEHRKLYGEVGRGDVIRKFNIEGRISRCE